MTLSDLVYHRSLAILWSAGHAPTRSQRINMQSAAWRYIPSALINREFDLAACALLRTYGYAPDDSKPYDEMLPETQIIHRYAPEAGHAVLLTGAWRSTPAGTTMQLSSTDDRGRFHIGKGHHYMTEAGSVSLSNGGPRSMLPLPADVLGKTDQIVRARFWRFHLNPEAGGGVDFTRPVPVWTWDGDDTVFTRDLEVVACH